MPPNYEFQQLFGGLHTAILPYNRMDAVHRGSLGTMLRDTIKYEAKVHGAAFDHVGFRNVTRALASGDVEVLFFAATWDVCEPKIIGATINFRSLFMERDGSDIKNGYGLYTEDVCLLTSKLRELVAEKPTGCRKPEISLGEHFQQQGLRYFAENGMAGGVFPVGGTYEYAPSNTKIIRNQQAIGSVLASERTSGLVRIEGLTPAMQEKLKVPVEELEIILPNGTIDPRNFLISWSGTNDRQKINVGFTQGLSSFVGNNLTQCQIISNGNLPSQSVIESVVASSLAVAEHKIQNEGLGIQPQQQARRFSPSIPLLGSAKEMHEALFELGGVEIAKNAPKVSDGKAIPAPTHIHVKNDEPEILEALQSLGAKQRMLGPNPMQTGSIDMTDRLEAAGTAENARLRLINREANGLQFGVAA